MGRKAHRGPDRESQQGRPGGALPACRRAAQNPFPYKLVQTPTLLVMLFEGNIVIARYFWMAVDIPRTWAPPGMAIHRGLGRRHAGGGYRRF
jgi:hypothetical protein